MDTDAVEKTVFVSSVSVTERVGIQYRKAEIGLNLGGNSHFLQL
jgi:hypothetical protein